MFNLLLPFFLISFQSDCQSLATQYSANPSTYFIAVAYNFSCMQSTPNFPFSKSWCLSRKSFNIYLCHHHYPDVYPYNPPSHTSNNCNPTCHLVSPKK